MNYKGLIKRFWEYNKKEPLGAVTIAFYLFLLEMWQKNNENDYNLSDAEICKRLKITRPTIGTLRQKLCNSGMIQYQPQNGLPGHYKIISEYSSVSSCFEKPKKIISEKKTHTEKLISQRETIQKQVLITENSSKNQAPIAISSNIPSLKEFTEYTKTLENYIPELDDLIKAKYDNWFKNGWKNGYNKPITNWKSSIKNGMAFLESELQSNSNISSKIALQTIKRPTSKFDE